MPPPKFGGDRQDVWAMYIFFDTEQIVFSHTKMSSVEFDLIYF